MADLNRDQVKAIVIASLQSIADLPDDVEAATFAMLNEEEKKVFLANLKTNLNESPYYDDNGDVDNSHYYDVDLTMSSLGAWANVAACIDWVEANQESFPKEEQQ